VVEQLEAEERQVREAANSLKGKVRGLESRVSELLQTYPYPGEELSVAVLKDKAAKPPDGRGKDHTDSARPRPRPRTLRPASAPPVRSPAMHSVSVRPYSGGSAALYLQAQEATAGWRRAHGSPPRVTAALSTTEASPMRQTAMIRTSLYPSAVGDEVADILERNMGLGRRDGEHRSWEGCLSDYHAYMVRGGRVSMLLRTAMRDHVFRDMVNIGSCCC
jgi:hypothetical protein